MTIGENLKRLREAKGITQLELAKEIGINRVTLARIERETRCLTLNLAKVIVNYLECDFEEFFK